jgi:sialidase-1
MKSVGIFASCAAVGTFSRTASAGGGGGPWDRVGPWNIFDDKDLKAVSRRARGRMDVFTAGQDGYHTYRIPSLVKASSGELLLFAEGRKLSSADHDWNDIVLKRSADGGASWGELQLVWSESTAARHVTIGNPSPVALRNGSVALLFTRDNLRVAATASHDGGASWEAPRYFPVALPAGGPPANLSHFATGPPGGVQLPSGRLVVPATFCLGASAPMTCHGAAYGASLALLSDDDGATWTASDAVAGGNECQVAAAQNGSLVLSMRSLGGAGARLWSWSADDGASWSAPTDAPFRFEGSPTYAGGSCQSSIARVGGALVFSTPFDKSARKNESLFISRDSGASWASLARLDSGATAYSSVAELDAHSAAVAWEAATPAAAKYGAIAFSIVPVP